MFDVRHKCADGVVRTFGMAFDSPSHARNGALMTRGGSMVSRADWARLSNKAKAKLVFDDLPESVRSPHVPSASDAEHRVEMLRHYLRGRGLDEEFCDQACELARREMTLEEEEPVEDELPENALHGGMGGALTGRSREPDGKRAPLGTTATGEKRSMVGEAEYRSSPASDEAFFAAFPDARRIQTGTPGSTQFDGANDRRSKRERRLAADAALDGAADDLADMFPGIENIGVGDFPRRR